MKTSDAINELADALSKAQAVIKPALKDSNNPAFNSKYADLSSVWEVARGPLTDNGLCIMQMPTHSDDNRLHLTTRLAHKSGQWIEDTMSIPVAKDNAHGYGSGITYCKRFALSAVLGIVADLDDDGNEAASANGHAKAPTGAGAKQEAIDARKRMDPAQQKFMLNHATALIDLHENSGDMVAYIRGQRLDNEEKLALWSLLPSIVRTAYKAQEKMELATQP